MPTELDPNAIAAEFVNLQFSKVEAFYKKTVKKARNKISIRRKDYEDYILRLINQYSRTKTFFIRHEPAYIYDFYVPLSLSTSSTTLERPGIADLEARSNFSIIIATGGSGKTIFLKHLLMSCLKQGEKTPIFIVLRHYDFTEKDLIDVLLENLNLNGLEIDEEYFDSAMEAGHFRILLDGYDELGHDVRERIASQIQKISVQYPESSLVLSSRHDDFLIGWTNFFNYYVEPLDIMTAIELIDKLLHYDKELRKKFIVDLKDHLFEDHKSFVSNPLLLSIMLLTYSSVGQIPGKLCDFYSQAYETLFYRHDALKGGYQREILSGLDVRGFARVFSVFCLLSYDKNAYSFSRLSALKYFDTAKEFVQDEYNSESVLSDSIQAVSLFVDDGLDLTFVHRSFQEYFVARFIDDANDEVKKGLLRRFGNDLSSSSIVSLYKEIDRESYERLLIIPVFEEFLQKIKYENEVNKEVFLRYLSQIYLNIVSAAHRGGGETTKLIRNVVYRFVLLDLISDDILKKANTSSGINLSALLLTHGGGIVFSEQHMPDDVFDYFWRKQASFESPVALESAILNYEQLLLRHQKIDSSLKKLLRRE